MLGIERGKWAKLAYSFTINGRIAVHLYQLLILISQKGLACLELAY